jgi:hypothetical protein
VSAFDLAFRPASYWDHPDPVTAIRSRITGQNRRRARIVLASVTQDVVGHAA